MLGECEMFWGVETVPEILCVSFVAVESHSLIYLANIYLMLLRHRALSQVLGIPA